VMLHVNRMVFGAPGEWPSSEPHRLPLSCRLTLILAAVPILVLGVYVPPPLHALLENAAAALAR
jgi:hypothetical protein